MNLKLVDPIAKIEKDIKLALVRDLNVYLNNRLFNNIILFKFNDK